MVQEGRSRQDGVLAKHGYRVFSVDVQLTHHKVRFILAHAPTEAYTTEASFGLDWQCAALLVPFSPDRSTRGR
eukprot:1975901-Prorocentrum_lima.AAC.1